MRSRLNAPRRITWFIALALGVLGILASRMTLPMLTPDVGYWLVVAGWALLLLASLMRGL